MSSHIMDEDETIAPQLFDKNNDYMETCDTEVNDMIPRLQRLSIADNEILYFSSSFFMDTDPSSIKQFESASIAHLNEAVSPMFVCDMSGEIWPIEDIKMAVDSNKSPSEIKETLRGFSMNTQVDIQSENVIQKTSEGGKFLIHAINAKEEQLLDKAKEMEAESVCDKDPLNYSRLKRNLDHNNEAKCSSAVSENKTLHQSYIFSPKRKRYIDSQLLAIEGTKVAFSKKSPSRTEETLRVLSMNMQADIQSQKIIRKASDSGELRMHPIDTNEEQLVDKAKETVAKGVFGEEPLDCFSTKPNLDYNNEAKSSSAVSENKTEHQSYIPEKKSCTDPNTGQAIVYSNIILPDTPGNNDEENALDLSNETATSTISDESLKLSYSADASSDDHSTSSGVTVDSPPGVSAKVGINENSVENKRYTDIRDFVPSDMGASESRQRRFSIFQKPSSIIDDLKKNSSDEDSSQTTKVNYISEVDANSVEKKRSRKVRIFVPPVAGMSEVRQRRFSIFQPPSSITDASNPNSSDEYSSTTTRVNKEDTPKKFRRKCKKILKTSPRLTTLCNSDVKSEEKRPSPCKRKNTTSGNWTETGKIRKRTISGHNLETSENTCSVIRSRSLSCGLEIIYNTSVTNPPTEHSVSKSARKRTNSGNHNANRVKSHKSSTSSDDA